MPIRSTTLSLLISATAIIGMTFSAASADPLTDRIADGDPIRLGFGTAIPFAYPGDSGEPLGFVNAVTLVALKEMGITDIETSVNDWSGLIPGLMAGRYDLVTGGMYILKSRCDNMNFSDPIGLFGDAMLVPKGNPMDIHNYADVVKTGARMVTGAGFNTVEAAKKEGVPESQMMLVAGEVEILAAMKAGRADVAVQTYFGAKEHAEQTEGQFEVTSPSDMPEWTKNWVGIGMSKNNPEFLEAFNAALAKVVGSEEWLAAAAPFGYTEENLPGPEASTEFACANR